MGPIEEIENNNIEDEAMELGTNNDTNLTIGQLCLIYACKHAMNHYTWNWYMSTRFTDNVIP